MAGQPHRLLFVAAAPHPKPRQHPTTQPCGSPRNALDRQRINRAPHQILQRAANHPGDTQQIDQPIGISTALLDSRNPLHRPTDLLSKTGLRKPRGPSPHSDIAADHTQQAQAHITSHEPQPYKTNCHTRSSRTPTVAKIHRQKTAETRSNVAEIHRQSHGVYAGSNEKDTPLRPAQVKMHQIKRNRTITDELPSSATRRKSFSSLGIAPPQSPTDYIWDIAEALTNRIVGMWKGIDMYRIVVRRPGLFDDYGQWNRRSDYCPSARPGSDVQPPPD
jgi:hypothetical protein